MNKDIDKNKDIKEIPEKKNNSIFRKFLIPSNWLSILVLFGENILIN